MTKQQRPMPPAECRDQAAALLRSHGFLDLGRGAGLGTSRYVKEKGGPFKIRLSTHGKGSSELFRYSDVLVSMCFTSPHTIAEVEAQVIAAVDRFRAALAARIQQAAG